MHISRSHAATAQQPCVCNRCTCAEELLDRGQCFCEWRHLVDSPCCFNNNSGIWNEIKAIRRTFANVFHAGRITVALLCIGSLQRERGRKAVTPLPCSIPPDSFPSPFCVPSSSLFILWSGSCQSACTAPSPHITPAISTSHVDRRGLFTQENATSCLAQRKFENTKLQLSRQSHCVIFQLPSGLICTISLPQLWNAVTFSIISDRVSLPASLSPFCPLPSNLSSLSIIPHYPNLFHCSHSLNITRALKGIMGSNVCLFFNKWINTFKLYSLLLYRVFWPNLYEIP